MNGLKMTPLDRMVLARTISKAALCMDDLSSNTCVITTEKIEEAKMHVENLHTIVEAFAGERAKEIYGENSAAETA